MPAWSSAGWQNSARGFAIFAPHSAAIHCRVFNHGQTLENLRASVAGERGFVAHHALCQNGQPAVTASDPPPKGGERGPAPSRAESARAPAAADNAPKPPPVATVKASP